MGVGDEAEQLGLPGVKAEGSSALEGDFAGEERSSSKGEDGESVGVLEGSSVVFLGEKPLISKKRNPARDTNVSRSKRMVPRDNPPCF